MKTIRSVIGKMLVDDMAVKDGKALFRIKDVMEKARKGGIRNPEEMLESEIKTGAIKIFGRDFIELDFLKQVESE